jgi:hypothetical protein
MPSSSSGGPGMCTLGSGCKPPGYCQ